MNTDFKNNVDNTNFQNHKILVLPQQMIIDTLPNNINLIIDYSLLAAVIILSFKIDIDSLYLLLVMLLFSLYKLWIDFEAVNYVVINLKSRKISIRSKNIFKILFKKNKQLAFGDIKTIYHSEESKLKSFTRYKLILVLKCEQSITLTDFKNEHQAITTSTKIAAMIK